MESINKSTSSIENASDSQIMINKNVLPHLRKSSLNNAILLSSTRLGSAFVRGENSSSAASGVQFSPPNITAFRQRDLGE